MWKFVFSAVLVAIVLDSACAKGLPSYLKLCQRNSDLNKCILENVETLKPRFKAAIPELFIPSLDPLEIPQASLNSGDAFKAMFTNIKVYNAYEFQLNRFDIDLDKYHVNIEITFPKLRILSDYNINGRILILNLDGKGPADGNYTNVQGSLSLKGTTFQKHNKEYLRWEQEKIDIKIGKIHLFFDRIFGDNVELNDQTNRVINQNIDNIVEDLQPVIQQIVSEFIFGLINRLFGKYSLDELFPTS